MTATVLDLSALLSRPAPDRTCPRCRDGLACFPHRLERLAHRLRSHSVDGELLVPASLLVDVIADALEVIDGITRECLPADHLEAQ